MALAAIAENFFPPAPADIVITLAAFLSHRGQTSALAVYLVTVVSNMAGALLVYGFARRFGGAFVRSRVGQALLSPSSVVAVERGYLRFGLVGLFAARLLPGIRSFTAPFAGLIRLSVPRALIPMAAASVLWYGVLVLVGSRLGAEWETVTRILSGINRTLVAVAALAALGLVAWWLRRHRRRGEEELREELETSLARYPAIESRALEDPAAAAVAALLIETALRAGSLSEEEVAALEHHLRNRWRLPGGTPPPGTEEATARRLIERMEPATRLGLARRLWLLAFSDGLQRRHEEHVMERVGQLLGLGEEELSAARRPEDR